MTDVLTIVKPSRCSKAVLPLIFDSPHSGNTYPDDFNHTCMGADLKRTEDNYVDDLFAGAPAHGASLLLAHFPRVYIDVNRAADDIDPALIDGDWPGPEPIVPSARSDAGIGLIRRLIKPGMPVYNRTLSAEEIRTRLDKYYHPYHNALENLINDAHYNFGQVLHVNCHSMPAQTAYPKRQIALAGNAPLPSDFVIGNRDGTTAGREITHMIRDHLKNIGYRVTINDPFKGVEIIRRHSNPARNIHSVQLEINKALYMDEENGEKSANYTALKTDIDELIVQCAAFIKDRLQEMAAD